MRISSNAYLGVESLVRLATCGTPCTTEQLARSIHRSVPYTEGLMASLCDAGFVTAQKGPGGGYYLSRSADRMTVAEILEAFDEPRVLNRRPLNAMTLEPETIENLHGTDLLWETLKSGILLFLGRISLADIAIDTAHSFADDETDGSRACHAHRPSTARH
jgi:Rrf2 family iron-sulfur cluster assembly transcriptional regulator